MKHAARTLGVAALAAVAIAAGGQHYYKALQTVALGGGAQSYSPSGIIFKQWVPASNVGTTETDVTGYTYAMPAWMATNGQGVRIYAWGTTAANGNAKTVRIYFGATAVSDITTLASGTSWFVDATVLRSAATTQVSAGFGNGNATGYNPIRMLTPAETLAGVVPIKLSLMSAVASSDVTGLGMLVWALP